jgi:hypothetical protein
MCEAERKIILIIFKTTVCQHNENTSIRVLLIGEAG